MNTAAVDARAVGAMREWLSDCPWPDRGPEEFDTMPEDMIVAGVARFYAGGLQGFMRDWRDSIDPEVGVGRG